MNTKKVAIKCTSKEQGAKIIEYLVELGGRNEENRKGNALDYYYYIRESNGVVGHSSELPFGYTEIQLPTTQQIGPEGKLMWVWDGDGENPKNKKRIVIFINEFMCVAVSDGYERAFKNKKQASVCNWKHCAEIEEPEPVELTMEEVCQKLGMNVKIVKK